MRLPRSAAEEARHKASLSTWTLLLKVGKTYGLGRSKAPEVPPGDLTLPLVEQGDSPLSLLIPVRKVVFPQQPAVVAECASPSMKDGYSLLSDHPPEQSSQGDMHRGKLPGSYSDLDHRPLELAWVGAVEILSWAEKGRPWCQGGTPSRFWPRSGR